jgi:hypothetical protein
LNLAKSFCYNGFPITGGSTVRLPGIGVSACPSKFLRAFFVAVLALAFLTQIASAQQTLGAITGTVTDPSGAVVPDATVKAVNIATNLEVAAQTKSNGSFVLPDLPAGTYRVTVTKDGFKTETHTKILVFGARTTTVDTTLVVGSIGTTVEVSAVPLMNQVDTTIGYVVDTKPSKPRRWVLAASRNWQFLALGFMRTSSVEAAPTRAWATRPSSRTETGTPAIAFP